MLLADSLTGLGILDLGEGSKPSAAGRHVIREVERRIVDGDAVDRAEADLDKQIAALRKRTA